MQRILLLLALLATPCLANAQLPPGSVAPDFTVQDISGHPQHLYDLLDSNRIVLLEISATWCPPCWAYHNSQALEDFHAQHGLAGDDRARVLWVEGDADTGLDCILGESSCDFYTPGDYTDGVGFPILNAHSIADSFQISYYPTLFIICPNHKLYEVEPLNANDLWEKAQRCPVAAGTNNAGIFDYDPGTDLREICGTMNVAPQFTLINLGSEALTAATLDLKWNNATVQTVYWTGNLPTFGEAVVSFEEVPLGSAGTLKTTVADLNNGAGDDDFSNNVRNDQFGQAAHFSTTQVLLKIRTDNYGEEIYWELRDDLGNVLEQGGNLDIGANGGGGFPLGAPIGAGAYASNTLIKDTLELPNAGCYSIHFVDSYGDGMCCGFGNGYYRLYNLDNPVVPIMAGGEFEDYSHRGFGAGDIVAASETLQNVGIQLFPNPANDFLNFQIALRTPAPMAVTVFNSLGESVHTQTFGQHAAGEYSESIAVADWPRGVYLLRLQAGTSWVMRKFVVER
jgi:hypothetical protein